LSTSHGTTKLSTRSDPTGWNAGGWRARGRSVAMMYGTGSLLVAVSMIPRSPSAVYRPGILGVSLLAACVAVTVLLMGRRYTMALAHVAVVGGAALIALLGHFGAGTYLSFVYGIFMVWVGQYSAMFFRRLVALRHVWIGAAMYAVGIATVPGVGSSKLVIWLTITGTSHVVVLAYSMTDRLSARLRGLVEHSGGVVAIIDPDLRFKYLAGPVERLSGYSRAEILGTSLMDWTHPDDAAQPLRAVAAALGTGQDTTIFESRMRRADGVWVNTESSIENATSNPSVEGLVVTIRDVTERKVLEERLAHQAFHDPLTNLPNRALFMDRVEHALARAGRSGCTVAVLMLDLDDFKGVNDTLGHAAGDELLREVGMRLGSGIRVADTVGRLGGDEFAVLLEDLQDVNEAPEAARRLLEDLRAPVVIKGAEVVMSASIGITVVETGLELPADLLRDADTAMYQAKHSGKARVERFEVGMHERLVRRVQLKSDMRRALEGNEFQLVYQPTVTLDTGEIHGVEALIRWDHPRLGRISPLEFIPAAEETGLIIPIGAWVLHEACRQAVQWQRRYPGSPGPTMNVNVSGRQLEHEGLLDEVRSALDETGLNPGKLVLEITESVLMHELEATVQRLSELRRLGVRVAIDDFGTGYSSLSYLNRLPIDLIKIDKSFVDRLHLPQELALVETIIKFGKILGVETVAEGIEKPHQAAQLQQIDCEYGQGYLFARPLDSFTVSALLLDGSLWQPELN